MNINNVNYLLKPWVDNLPIINTPIKKITLDSRTANYQDVFIAVKGNRLDGRKFIDKAIKQGVIAVVAEADKENLNGKIVKLNNIPIIYLSKLSQHLSRLAGRFYNNPSHNMSVIGVTGTNGKSTITNFLSQWVNAIGEKSAVMGTLGNGILNEIYPNINTTCSAIEIQYTLANFLTKKVKFCAMEVSSHGLIQHRVNDLHFAAAIFINLSHDHLDYHQHLKQYENAKKKLFYELDVNKKIINIDDNIGLKWANQIPNTIIVTSFEFKKSYKHWFFIKEINNYEQVFYIKFNSSWGDGIINSKLIGEHNIKNMLLALVSLLALDYPLVDLLNTINQLKLIIGRMEHFTNPNKPSVIIDYAHNPKALATALISSRKYCQGKLWCIFGCGGERDQIKRPLMGAIAEQYADKVIITNDNPRNENPHKIIANIISGLVNKSIIKVIPDRTEAITNTLKLANATDIILIAGKGHEDYQIIGNNKNKFSDHEVINQIFNK